MKYNFIHIKLKDKNNIDLNNNKTLDLFKLSAGNNIIIKKESSSEDLEISYYKKYIKSNIGIMIYKKCKDIKEIKILNKIFVSKNKERARIIINNKQYELKEKIENQKQFLKIKIKYIDNIFYLNCMFKDCNLLSSIKNFQNINTKYLKSINFLYSGCSSLLYNQ